MVRATEIYGGKQERLKTMKWEKKIDTLLIGKHRREYVNVPTNVLRQAKKEKQALIKDLKNIGLRYHVDTRLLQVLIDSIETMCHESKKGKRGATIKNILNSIYKFKQDFDVLSDGLCEHTLNCIKEDEKKK